MSTPHTLTRPLRSRVALLALLAVVALFAALLATTPALAQGGGQALDLDADDTVATAIDWSTLAFPDGADEVLLGRADLFADSLASGGLQAAAATAADGRPLLLTPRTSLDPVVEAELERLAPTTVHIMGGTAAIDQAVADRLTELGYTVNRFEGPTRIETAIDVAEELDSDTALLVRAFASPDNADPTQEFADTLAAAAWAAENGWAVLFTQTETLTPSTRDHLEAAEYATLYVIGGDAAVNDEVMADADELAGEVTRVEGETRFETAVAIAEQRGITTHEDAGLSILVDGQGADAWADGFAAAALAGREGFPVVLANSATEDLPQATVDFLTPADGTPVPPVPPGFAQPQPPGGEEPGPLARYSLICGPTAPDAQCQQAAEILGLTVVGEGEEPPVDGSNQDLEVTPTDEAEIQGEETRQFTVTEPAADTTYTIALVPAENVTVDEAGVVTFTATEDGTAAGLGETDAQITQVNGTDTDGEDLQTAEGSPGLTFTIGGATFEEVYPVVFVDADEDGALDLNADGTPIEAELFGLGGFTRILPPPAEGQTGPQDAEIVYVDLEGARFATADATFTVEEGDTLQVIEEGDAPLDTPSPIECSGAEASTVEDFLAVLTVGDQLDGTSSAAAEGADTLCLEDATPVAPTVAVDETTDTTVLLTVTDVAEDAVVTIYRAEAPAEGEEPAADPAADEVLVEDAADSDPDTDGVQVLLEGLTPETDYHLYATQTQGQQESDPSNIVTTRTRGDIAIVAVQPAGDENDGQGSTDQVTIQFSVPVNVVTVEDITVTDESGVRTLTGAEVTVGDGSQTVTIRLDGTPTGQMPDSPQDVTYTVTVADGAVETAADGEPAPELTGTFAY